MSVIRMLFCVWREQSNVIERGRPLLLASSRCLPYDIKYGEYHTCYPWVTLLKRFRVGHTNYHDPVVDVQRNKTVTASKVVDFIRTFGGLSHTQ